MTNIKHEIISADPTTGKITVKYWSDSVPEGVTQIIDVPLIDGAYVSAVELEAEIVARTPLHSFERAKADFSHIAALVVAPAPAPTTDAITRATDRSHIDISGVSVGRT